MGIIAIKHMIGFTVYITQNTKPVVKIVLVMTLSHVRMKASTNCMSCVALDVRSPTVLLSRNVKDFDWIDL